MKKLIICITLMFCALQIVAQEMPKVAGVEFGWPYSKCKRILDNKFNGCDDSYQSEKNMLEYRNISFADSFFDYVHFNFQSDGSTTYLSSIYFVSYYDLSDVESAKKQRDQLYKLYSEKYEYRWNGNDENGFKYYVLGYHPQNANNGLIVISTYKAKNKGGIMKYWTQVSYAGIDFVKPTDDI